MDSIVIWLLVGYLAGSMNCIIQEMNFSRTTLCSIEEQLKEGCVKKIPLVRSRIECIAKCSRDAFCIGSSRDSQGNCYHHEICVGLPSCTSLSTNVEHWSGPCVHGRWDKTEGRCQCINYAYRGSKCDKYHSDCHSLATSGLAEGTYRVVLELAGEISNRVKVVAFVNPNHFNCEYYVSKNTGKLGANRTWGEYYHGFYVDETNFFMGMRAWRLLNLYANADYLMTVAYFKPGASASMVSRYFKNFKLIADNYKYIYGETGMYSPIPGIGFGNCFPDDVRGQSLSTWDNDNDDSPDRNCAAVSGQAGWYADVCQSACNFLGLGGDDWDNIPPALRLRVAGIGQNDLRHLDILDIIYRKG